MSRYIDAEAIDFSPLKNDFDRVRAKVVIMGQPTADVVEVRHGEWIVITEERDTIRGKVKLQYKECSVCGYPMGLCGSLYCGNCGAKMDGERREG